MSFLQFSVNGGIQQATTVPFHVSLLREGDSCWSAATTVGPSVPISLEEL